MHLAIHDAMRGRAAVAALTGHPIQLAAALLLLRQPQVALRGRELLDREAVIEQLRHQACARRREQVALKIRQQTELLARDLRALAVCDDRRLGLLLQRLQPPVELIGRGQGGVGHRRHAAPDGDRAIGGRGHVALEIDDVHVVGQR